MEKTQNDRCHKKAFFSIEKSIFIELVDKSHYKNHQTFR